MTEQLPEDVACEAIENAKCTCHFVDIGVGYQKAAEDPTCPICTPFGRAMAVVGALSGAGHLFPPGGETETQHAVRWPSGWVQRFADRDRAEAAVKERREWAAGDPSYGDGVVVHRTVVRWREGRKTSAVYTGPWRELQP